MLLQLEGNSQVIRVAWVTLIYLTLVPHMYNFGRSVPLTSGTLGPQYRFLSWDK